MSARLRPIRRRAFLLALAAATRPAEANAGVVVIGNPNLSTLDLATLEKVYTGRVIELNGVSITAVNASAGSPVRSRFLQAFLKQDDDKYTAYWVVRRYIGKGAPPRELSSGAAIVNFVKSTPGAIGYVDESEVQPGVVVLLK